MSLSIVGGIMLMASFPMAASLFYYGSVLVQNEANVAEERAAVWAVISLLSGAYMVLFLVVGIISTILSN